MPSVNETYTQLGRDIAADQEIHQTTLDTLNETEQQLTGAQLEIRRLEAIIASMNAPAPFGVASHQLTYRTPSSIYSNDGLMEDMMDWLGNLYVRDMLPITGETAWGVAYQTMLRNKAKQRQYHLTIGKWSLIDTYDWAKAISRLEQVSDCLVEVAGVNEPDDAQNGGNDFSLVRYAKHQKALYTRVRSVGALNMVQVCNGALRGENPNWRAANEALVTACRGYMDVFNAHWYPGPNSDVEQEFMELMLDIRTFWDGPVLFSEAGGSTANMSLAEQARIDKAILECAAKEGVKVYLYELADDVDITDHSSDADPNPSDNIDPADKKGNVQMNFGVFESTGEPKPAAVACAVR